MNNKELIENFFQDIFNKFQEKLKNRLCPIIGSYVIDNSSVSSTDIIKILKDISGAQPITLPKLFRSHLIFNPQTMFEIVFNKLLIFSCNINNLKYCFTIKNCKYYYFGDNNKYIFLKFEGAKTFSMEHIKRAKNRYKKTQESRISKLKICNEIKVKNKNNKLNDDSLLFYHAENNHIQHNSKKEIIEDKLNISERTIEGSSDSEDYILSNSEDYILSESEDYNLSDSEDDQNGGENNIINHKIIADIFDLSFNDYIEKKKNYYQHANLKYITNKIVECNNKKEIFSLSTNCLTNDIFIPFNYIEKNLYNKYEKLNTLSTSKGGKKILRKHKTKKHKTKKHKTKKHKTRKKN